ncbi:MAG: hypothetical protein HQL30_10300 [Candidatus Omnitrophica bacterium]|nr:hypothetical protein [Candidatus Omnitrophota bacterium]
MEYITEVLELSGKILEKGCYGYDSIKKEIRQLVKVSRLPMEERFGIYDKAAVFIGFTGNNSLRYQLILDLIRCVELMEYVLAANSVFQHNLVTWSGGDEAWEISPLRRLIDRHGVYSKLAGIYQALEASILKLARGLISPRAGQVPDNNAGPKAREKIPRQFEIIDIHVSELKTIVTANRAIAQIFSDEDKIKDFYSAKWGSLGDGSYSKVRDNIRPDFFNLDVRKCFSDYYDSMEIPEKLLMKGDFSVLTLKKMASSV